MTVWIILLIREGGEGRVGEERNVGVFQLVLLFCYIQFGSYKLSLFLTIFGAFLSLKL